MKKRKYELEKLFHDFKGDFADYIRERTKAKQRDGFNNFSGALKKAEWSLKFDKKNKKLLNNFYNSEKKFLNKINPKLLKSYLDYIKND